MRHPRPASGRLTAALGPGLALAGVGWTAAQAAAGPHFLSNTGAVAAGQTPAGSRTRPAGAAYDGISLGGRF